MHLDTTYFTENLKTIKKIIKKKRPKRQMINAINYPNETVKYFICKIFSNIWCDV